MSDSDNDSGKKNADDVVAVIGREIAAMHGALLALTSVMARQGDASAMVSHLLTIRASAAKEPNSTPFTDIIDRMIDVARPALH
jgi:hypothetical protein